jgi:transposase-like protein
MKNKELKEFISFKCPYCMAKNSNVVNKNGIILRVYKTNVDVSYRCENCKIQFVISESREDWENHFSAKYPKNY